MIGPDPSNASQVMQIEAPAAAPATALPDRGNPHLRRVAQDLEAAFISEMLKHSGMAGGRSGLGGGGAGEDQFASLLRAEHARLFAERGGIGLAENIYRALLAREGAGGEAPR
jgi:peptidoglycan hydrolase FlgJ